MPSPTESTPTDSNVTDPTWNYEATVSQIEAIVARIESGELDLADVFEQFSAAVDYLRQCEAFLTDKQQQMDVLIETLMDEKD